jgi:hypothetical protein
MTQTGEPRSGERSESATDRAEHLMEQMGETAGTWLSRTAARVREEAEDIWAEAQGIRHGDRGGTTQG